VQKASTLFLSVYLPPQEQVKPMKFFRVSEMQR
jgi:hypothetical protein